MKKSNLLKIAATLLVCMLLFPLALTGCASKSAASTPASAAPSKDEAITLRISCIPGVVADMLRMNAEEFEKKNHNVTISIEEYPEDQYQNQAPMIFESSESKPDLAWYWKQMWYNDMVDSGLFMNLDDLYTREKWEESLGKSALELYTSPDGHKYAVNHDMVWTPNLYYNIDAFKEAGVEVPKTMDELYAAAAKLKEKGYIPCAIGATSAVPGHLFNALLTRSVTDEQYVKLMDSTKKYDEINYESPEVVSVFDTVKKLTDEVFQEGCTGVDSLEAQSLFVQGKAAMYFDGSWAVANITEGVKDSFKVGVFQFPAILPEIGTPASTFIGDAMMILADTKYPELAQDFLAQIMSKEMQSRVTEAKLAPPARNDISEESLKKMGELYITMYADMRANGAKPLWYMTQGAELTNKSYEIVSGVMSGAISSQDAAAQFQAVYDASLE
ncbi:MAG: extracellular solute-binding protein [Ruthenibacterium sp.]